jgi:glycosyltransferase involved in cell wall biosynthesis
VVIGLHGPNLWAKSVGNQETIDKIGDLEMDYMERKSVEMADYVVSPSRYLLEWMSKEGWPVNPASFVQPNVLPLADRQAAAAMPRGSSSSSSAPQRLPVQELVFFARLETRKGVVMFCDAMDQLFRPQVAGLYGGAVQQLERITFLGRGAMVNGQFGVNYVQDRAQKWGVPWKIISRMGPDEAKAYLREPDAHRLAVMPSRIENSPYTVYECAEMGIPFVASRVGGVPDLVLPEDHAEALFEPTTDALLGRLVAALTNGVYPARPKFQADLNEQVWLNWHLDITQREKDPQAGDKGAEATREAVAANAYDTATPAEAGPVVPFVSVVMTHYNRPHLLKWAVESVELQVGGDVHLAPTTLLRHPCQPGAKKCSGLPADRTMVQPRVLKRRVARGGQRLPQDYPSDRYELILIDDGSTQEDVAPYLDELEERFSTRGWTIVRSTNMYLGAARNKAVTFRYKPTWTVSRCVTMRGPRWRLCGKQ